MELPGFPSATENTLRHIAETRCGYVILLMSIYFMTEAIPLGVTALIPVFAFPLLGVLSSSIVCSTYSMETNIFFLGGLIVAVTIEHCNLHKRIALFVILHVGQSPRKLMFGFMLNTMLLSMWISNTASTAMMIPIVQSVLKELEKTMEMKDLDSPRIDERTAKQDTEEGIMINPEDTKYLTEKSFSKYGENENLYNPEEANMLYNGATEKNVQNISDEKEKKNCGVDFKTLKTMYFLGVAYAANVGGTGSLTGTGPNLIMKGILDDSYDEPNNLNFGTWMIFNVPGMILCTLSCFIWLQFLFVGFGSRSKLPNVTEKQRKKVKEIITNQYKSLGKISFHESSVLIVFVTLALLWFFREPGFMPGWGDLFKFIYPNITYGNVVPTFLAVVFMSVLPSHPNFWPNGPSESCITWKILQEKLPWNIFLLIGGGKAIARGFVDSGLSLAIGEKLKIFDSFPPSFSALVFSISIALGTEVASNGAMVAISMPILNEIALRTCINPLFLMLPAVVCCSYAFMLPVSTPPNALVYGVAGGDMKIKDMLKAGIVMNILCVLIINLMINTLGVAMFNVGELPSWANSTTTQEHIQQCWKNSSVLV
ncbi:Solute carrier family 13 member 3 [Armadillidium nasatum]|uniref:Solute carrier family 13 member 3 n=1 Tax=Armadillidium nasatum TaxID=96803 RepID=A0A5N5TLI5_9CRUS|nr:Solute carrier family 13 member 3 [Armadillidium nasatum]